MLAGPNLPADISIPWHSANWQHCRREKERERERRGATERKLVNNRRREGCERMRGGWERSMNQEEKERKTDTGGGKEDGERKNNNGGLRKGELCDCVCVCA